MLRRLLVPFLALAQCSSAGAADDAPAPYTKPVKQVAIIGAGAAGASTAYHLRKFAEEEDVAINITLFEKTDHIGGRTLTANVYGSPLEPVELGASIFVQVNEILVNATRDFNLPYASPGTDEAGALGIWNGDEFVFQVEADTWWGFDLVKLVWKYGTAPYYVNKLVKETVATFLQLYRAPYFPFRSLTSRVYELDLLKTTGMTATQFLEEKKLNGPYARDIVQTGTRVNYMSNLAYIHGMGAMVSMAAEGAMAVRGGNWQIFANMAKKSGAHVCLNTSVTSIELQNSSEPDASRPKYTMKTAESGNAAAEQQPIQFDDVVIATPYQFSNITTGASVLQTPIDAIPYAKLHVTLFASPFRFSPEFFNLPPGTKAPISVITTLGPDEAPQSGGAGAGKAGFFSATLVKKAFNPKTAQIEYVYKIFSPEAVTPAFLSALLGVKVPDTFTRATDAEDAETYDVVETVSWYYPTVFHPYPELRPRVTFQDPVVGPGLYYTSGIESFISTMETSALMGANVARLLVDGYAGKGEAAEQDEEPVLVVEEGAGYQEAVLGSEELK